MVLYVRLVVDVLTFAELVLPCRIAVPQDKSKDNDCLCHKVANETVQLEVVLDGNYDQVQPLKRKPQPDEKSFHSLWCLSTDEL